MSYTRLTVDVQDKVGQLVLSQPDEYNRMPPAFWEEFPDALEALDQQGDVRALVISSTGKHFSAGMDVSAFTGPRTQDWDRGRAGEMARRNLQRLQAVFSRLEDLRMPVLAAIQGGCVGGGVDLVAACDMRYCTAEAFFCIQEINIGLAADVGTLQRLQIHIGKLFAQRNFPQIMQQSGYESVFTLRTRGTFDFRHALGCHADTQTVSPKINNRNRL